MTSLNKIMLSVGIGAAALSLSALSASAAVVCSSDVCWHTHERYEYPPSARVVIHDDGWKAGPHIRFREHEGRGYWSGDRWTAW